MNDDIGPEAIIWRGELEWQEMMKASDKMITLKVESQVGSTKDGDGNPYVSSENWPEKLEVKPIPKSTGSKIHRALIDKNNFKFDNIQFHLPKTT